MQQWITNARVERIMLQTIQVDVCGAFSHYQWKLLPLLLWRETGIKDQQASKEL